MKTKKITITRTFTHTDEETYRLIPFDLPSDVEKLKIRLKYDKGAGKNIIDLGLAEPDGRQNGATGGRVNEIEISARYATPGYRAVEPYEGEWNIISGIYRVKNKVEVTYEVEFQFKERRWFFGDTHLHTIYSDGSKTPDELIELARKKGLDFMINTDHNNSNVNRLNKTHPEMTIIKGVELTLFDGHMNVWNLKDEAEPPYFANDFEEMASKAAAAKYKGCVTCINHPTCRNCGWKYPLEGIKFDAMEIWNGPMRTDNMTAVELWKKELLKGKRIAAVGGSDYHRDYLVTKLCGYPTTAVFAESSSPDDIAKALKNGNAVITSNPRSEMIYSEYNGCTYGEVARFSPAEKLKIKAVNLKKGDILTVFNNEKIIFEQTVSSKELEFNLSVEQYGFVYAQISTKYGKLKNSVLRFAEKKMLPGEVPKIDTFIRCITNPIYIEP